MHLGERGHPNEKTDLFTCNCSSRAVLQTFLQIRAACVYIAASAVMDPEEVEGAALLPG